MARRKPMAPNEREYRLVAPLRHAGDRLLPGTIVVLDIVLAEALGAKVLVPATTPRRRVKSGAENG